MTAHRSQGERSKNEKVWLKIAPMFCTDMQKATTEICDNNMTPRYKLGQRWRQTDSTDLLGGASAGSTFGSIMASFFPRLTKERGVGGGRKVFEKSRLVLSRNLSNQNKFATPRSSSLTMSSG